MRGGKRENAGRKVGSATKRTREIADKAAASGITPLEAMLKALQIHYEAGRFDEAAAVAKDAAPYCHPRLAAIQHTVDGTPLAVISAEPMSEDEWLERCTKGAQPAKKLRA